MLFAFGVAGTIFFGLTIASPVAVPAAVRRGIELSAADLATAQHLASMWWLFALGAVLSFAAALATIGNLIQHLGPSPEK
jgi:drug/metabolite transporter (DMT)-like permease